MKLIIYFFSKLLSQQILFSKMLIITGFLFFANFQAKADCTITANISASNFLATYGSCTGTLTIPNGVVLTIDAPLTMPSGINRVIIANGGQIAWTNGSNLELRLAQNTAIVIENTSTTTGTQALSGACNNNDEIHIGTVEYAVCVGGGACIDFATLTANGGTIQIDPLVVVSNNTQPGNIVCSNTFDLNVAINGFVYGTPTYSWSQTSGPGTSTFSTSNTIQAPTITVSALGIYTFKVEVTVALSETCLTTFLTVNSTITVDVRSCVQPLNLISFSGKIEQNHNQLYWETSREESFSHFEIERSTSNHPYEKIGQIFGLTNNAERNIYKFKDENISSNDFTGYYYRLKMLDLDGKFEYSKIIFIKNENQIIKVGNFYPNPSLGNEVSIKIITNERAVWNITSYDIAGKLISEYSKTLESGENILTFKDFYIPFKNAIFSFDNGKTVIYRKLLN